MQKSDNPSSILPAASNESVVTPDQCLALEKEIWDSQQPTQSQGRSWTVQHESSGTIRLPY